MRKALLSIQSIFILVFLITFITSFFVVEQIQERSRTLVTEKVTQGTMANIGLAEEVLNSKAASMYLEDYQIDVIRSEIDTFKNNPYGYIVSITMNDENGDILPPEFRTANPLKSALFEKLFQWKQGLKSYFNKTFNGLITDIRIFLGTNVVALLIAALVCFKSATLGSRAMVISTIITIVTALSALSYVNDSWLFNILLNSYAGYGYAGTIAFFSGWLYHEYDRRENN